VKGHFQNTTGAAGRPSRARFSYAVEMRSALP
jgi:hypothetical protein